MSEGKMNYERQRARAEIRAELSKEYGKPYDVQSKRQIETYLLYVGAVALRTFVGQTSLSATKNAFELLEAAKRDAKLLTPGPDTEQDDADA